MRTVKVDGCQLVNHIFRGRVLLEDASAEVPQMTETSILKDECKIRI